MPPKGSKKVVNKEVATSGAPEAADVASPVPQPKKRAAPAKKTKDDGAVPAKKPRATSKKAVAPVLLAAESPPPAAAEAAEAQEVVAAKKPTAKRATTTKKTTVATEPIEKVATVKKARAPAKKKEAITPAAEANGAAEPAPKKGRAPAKKKDAADADEPIAVVQVKKARATKKKPATADDNDNDTQDEVIISKPSKSRAKKLTAEPAEPAEPASSSSKTTAATAAKAGRGKAKKADEPPAIASASETVSNGNGVHADVETSEVVEPAAKGRAKKPAIKETQPKAAAKPKAAASKKAATTNGNGQQNGDDIDEDESSDFEDRPKVDKKSSAPRKRAAPKAVGKEPVASPQPAKRPAKAAPKKKSDAIADGAETSAEKPATASRKRAAPKAAKAPAVADQADAVVASPPPAKRPTKAAPKKKTSTETADTESPVVEAANATVTDYAGQCFDLPADKPYTLKISSWNVAGLRAICKKDGMRFLEHQQPDIFCMQEIKCVEDEVPAAARPKGYHYYWNALPGGHAGVALYTRTMPYNVHYGFDLDASKGHLKPDGRLITAEYLKYFVVCVYVPNAGRKLVTLPERLHWNAKFQRHLASLNAKKPVIVCGDLNVSHRAIDLANPKANARSAGFTEEERAGMDELLADGFVDTYRHFYPEKTGAYTYWTYMANARKRNVGWRLDYFLTSERLVPKVVDNVICSFVLGSDHCPITLFMNV